jgi:type II secretory pathway pseudopilin PulG
VPSRGERGAALLEAIVALTILAVAGTAAVVMAGESARAVTRAREAETAVREAGALLEAVALWTREDLDRRLGDRPQGRWVMRVDRPTRDLYLVALRDSASDAVVLRTSLFRPEAADAPRP